MTKVRTLLVFSFLILTFAYIARSDAFNLSFSIAIDDGTGGITTGIFFAQGSEDPNVAEDFDIRDLRQPPVPPGDYVYATTLDTGIALIKDNRPFDSNAPDLFYPIQLIAYNDDDTGLTGTSRFVLTNPEELGRIPNDSLVYLRRYDANNVFVEYYNLRDPNNHIISWPVVQVQGTYTTMELIIKSKCLAANFDGLAPVNLKDLAILADCWKQSGVSIAGDADGDTSVDLNDLAIIAETWLSNCYP